MRDRGRRGHRDDLLSPTNLAESNRRACGGRGGVLLTSVQVLSRLLPMAFVRQRGRRTVAAETAAEAAGQRRIRRLRPSDGAHARGDRLPRGSCVPRGHPGRLTVSSNCVLAFCHTAPATASVSLSVSVMSVEVV